MRCFPVNSAKFLRTLFYRTPPVAASENSSFIDVWQDSKYPFDVVASKLKTYVNHLEELPFKLFLAWISKFSNFIKSQMSSMENAQR